MPDPVFCPDCGLGHIRPGDRCDVCGLSWEDMEAATAFIDELVADRRSAGEAGLGLGDFDAGGE